MGRPVTLFTGQWADLPLADLAAKCRTWGFDGLELACWGDHFEVDRVLAEDSTLEISATCSAGTVSSAGRSARTWSDRRCAIASMSGIGRFCRLKSGAMASRTEFGHVPRSG